MIDYHKTKEALFTERAGHSLSEEKKKEAIQRLIERNVIQLPQYAIVAYDRKANDPNFNISFHSAYACVNKELDGLHFVDELCLAQTFSWDEIPEKLKDQRVKVNTPMAQVTRAEVEKALYARNWSEPLSIAEKDEVADRLQKAGLLKDELYYIHVVEDDEASYVNLGSSGSITLEDRGQTKHVQTKFTQSEIDNNPVLKALKHFKEPV